MEDDTADVGEMTIGFSLLTGLADDGRTIGGRWAFFPANGFGFRWAFDGRTMGFLQRMLGIGFLLACKRGWLGDFILPLTG